MYPPMETGTGQVVLRPMNCPHHILVYASEPRTMRDMPLRLAELGTMFRYERSGVIGGLSRARQMTLNDGHVFCAPEHVEDADPPRPGFRRGRRGGRLLRAKGRFTDI
jgi:threonyl-tRNA synthetase